MEKNYTDRLELGHFSGPPQLLSTGDNILFTI